MRDKYIIFRNVNGSHPNEINRFDTLEEAEMEVNDFRRYSWINNEEITIVRAVYTPVLVVKAAVVLDKRQL